MRKAEAMARIEAEKTFANDMLNNAEITIEQKTAWSEYLIALEHSCLCPDFDCDPKLPTRPNA